MKADEHKQFTIASLKERLLFHDWVQHHPNYVTNVSYSDPEGADKWDVIFTLSGETKPRIADIKVRDKGSVYNGYIIQQDKFNALTTSADTYTCTYINFFDDANMLLWTLTGGTPSWSYKRGQTNNITNEPIDKLSADLPTSAATRHIISTTPKEAGKRAEKLYNDRLNPNHSKRWKKL